MDDRWMNGRKSVLMMDGEMEEQMNGLMSRSELRSKLSCCRFLALRCKTVCVVVDDHLLVWIEVEPRGIFGSSSSNRL